MPDDLEVDESEDMPKKTKAERKKELEEQLAKVDDEPDDDTTEDNIADVDDEIEREAKKISKKDPEDVEDESQDAAEDIAEDSKLTLSDREVDAIATRIAKRSIELQNEMNAESAPKKPAPRTRDKPPKPTHWSQRKIGGRK